MITIAKLASFRYIVYRLYNIVELSLIMYEFYFKCTSPADGCNDRGECVDGSCQCDTGFDGDHCEIGGQYMFNKILIKNN